jgi:hypothetical protein
MHAGSAGADYASPRFLSGPSCGSLISEAGNEGSVFVYRMTRYTSGLMRKQPEQWERHDEET